MEGMKYAASTIYHILTTHPLHQRNLRHFSGIALTPAKFRDTSIATGANSITRRQFVKNFLDDQFIRKRFQDTAACMQFYNYCLERGLQCLLSFILVRNDTK